MTVLDIAFAVSLGLVATALVGAFHPREWSWRHRPARLPLAAHATLTFTLVAEALWADATETANVPLAAWLFGTIIGSIVGYKRSRDRPKTGEATEVPDLPA